MEVCLCTLHVIVLYLHDKKNCIAVTQIQSPVSFSDKAGALDSIMYFYRKLQQTNKRFTRLLKDLGKPLLYMYVNIWFTDLCFYRGVPAGEENGRRGYLFTFVVAYIRVRCHSHSSCMRTLSCNVCQKL